jgi:hypothetical protein
MRRPSVNASPSVTPAPAALWWPCHHARRCSSDRKKLSLVQSTVHARPSSGPDRVTHTMRSRASGPGPSGPTANPSGASQ